MYKRRDEIVEKIATILRPSLDGSDFTLNEIAEHLVDNGVHTADGFEVTKTNPNNGYCLCEDEVEIKPINYSEVDNEG